MRMLNPYLGDGEPKRTLGPTGPTDEEVIAAWKNSPQGGSHVTFSQLFRDLTDLFFDTSPGWTVAGVIITGAMSVAVINMLGRTLGGRK